MLHFFRKIRRELLAKNNFFRYLKYGIGEIILVVIGILIAIQVDNWNENRKSEERTKHLFSQVQKELLYNISRTDFAINYYLNNDSLFHKVIKEKAAYKDYESNPYLCRLITHVNSDVEAQDNAFKLLIENAGAFTQEQDSLIGNLRNLYGLDLLKVNDHYDLIIDMVNDFRRKLKDQKTWYSDLIGGPGFSDRMNNVLTEEMINYFLYDPTYRNEVQDFVNVGYGPHLKGILGFRARAISIYQEIAKYLDEPPDQLLAYNIDDFTHYLGSYKNEKGGASSYDENWTAVIDKERDRLQLKIYESGSFKISYDIYPFSNDAYIAIYEMQDEIEGVLNQFIYDERAGKKGIILVGDYGPKNKERPLFLKVD